MDTPATLLTYDTHLRQLTVFVPEHKKRRYTAESTTNPPIPGPVYRLSNEMLASALEYLGLRDALSASAVCKWWRDISLATPVLWTCVRISSPTRESDADAADHGDHALPARLSGVSALSLEHARSWLDRSKSLPITIYVELHASSRRKWSKKLAKLLSLYAPRIAELHILGSGTWRVTKPVLSAILPQATKLTSFSLDCDTNGGDAGFASIAALAGAPAALRRLQCLTIGKELRWRASDLETNRFAALQGLELSIDDVACLPRVLAACPHLRILCVSIFPITYSRIISIDYALLARVADRAARVDDLHVSWVNAGHVSFLAALFPWNAHRQRYRIDCGGFCDATFLTSALASDPIVKLSHIFDGWGDTVCVTSQSGNERTLKTTSTYCDTSKKSVVEVWTIFNMTLLPHCDTLRHLEIPLSLWFDLYLCYGKTSWPALEVLELRVAFRYDNFAKHNESDTIAQSVPHLEKLLIIGDHSVPQVDYYVVLSEGQAVVGTCADLVVEGDDVDTLRLDLNVGED